MPTRLRIHHFLNYSRANGPGVRAALWLQGCTLGCPGCFNPATHSLEQGAWQSIDEVLARILALGEQIEGLTISGGEPFQQPGGLFALLDGVRRSSPLSVLVFSGYTWSEISRSPERARVLPLIDVLIAGRYRAAQRTGKGMIGSSNQRIYLLSDRYSLAEVQAAPAAEVIITETGEVMQTGIDPL